MYTEWYRQTAFERRKELLKNYYDYVVMGFGEGLIVPVREVMGIPLRIRGFKVFPSVEHIGELIVINATKAEGQISFGVCFHTNSRNVISSLEERLKTKPQPWNLKIRDENGQFVVEDC